MRKHSDNPIKSFLMYFYLVDEPATQTNNSIYSDLPKR